MAKTAFKGTPVSLSGELPAKGSAAKDFSLVAADLSEKNLASFAGKRKVLNIVPSLDTGICAASTRVFNQRAGEMNNTVVLVISKDLPFAMKRFCEVEGIKNVVSLSDFRGTFAEDYGVRQMEGPLKGLLGRCIVVLDENDKVIYTQLVPEITTEPDYDSAIKSLG